MRSTLSAFLLIGLLCSFSARAEVWQGGGDTAQVGFEEQRRAGELSICNLSFIQIIRDDINRSGDTSKIHGIVSLNKTNDKTLVYSLVIYGEDQISNGKCLSFSPAFAYLSGPKYSSAHRESVIFSCGGPGFCAGYGGDENLMGFLGLTTQPTLNVSFQRQQGGIDFPFVVHWSSDDSTKAPPIIRFALCGMALVQSLK